MLALPLAPLTFALVLQLFAQGPLDYELLVVEDGRSDEEPLVSALEDPSPQTRRQAVRALGRYERAELATHVTPFLSAAEPELRIEAANALAQMKSGTGDLLARLAIEKEPRVRAVLYQALGRLRGTPNELEAVLVKGLGEGEPARYGAAKGLEHLLRTREHAPGPAARNALRDIVRASTAPRTRQLALLALARGGETDAGLFELAFRDPDPRVRRLAVLGLSEWRDDPSPMVRYAALKSASSCENAAKALGDASEHVVLLGIDSVGDGCAAGPLGELLTSKGWRRSARALVSLAKVDRNRALRALPKFARHDVWQARVYAAKAAKILDAQDVLEALREDEHPNVVAESITAPEHALAALASHDYGLLMRALALLEGWEGGRAELGAALRRVSAERRATSRDPRRLMLQRLSELGAVPELDYLLDDFDPFIASLAASIVNAERRTPRFAPASPPSEAFVQALSGATARIEMKEAGTFTIELLPEEAPFTAAQFARLADGGYYDGLTFHRIVPNFVLQGGSPGANEFMGTAEYIRDEVGLLSHERGTLGISTRGRDTGDSQIFINLVDNFRLDHNYTVFARVIDGMEDVDRIQEGDVMMRVRIVRR